MGDWMRRMRHLYPPDWEQLARKVKAAAGWKCEGCDAPHGPPPHILTVDHLDHNPGNNHRSNLVALCQRCHLRRQGLKPRPKTKREALAKLRRRAEEERTQLTMTLDTGADVGRVLAAARDGGPRDQA